ncbi:MAG: TVP38/TMEM64 family protein [Chlamydiota bacterium]|nr:TVP38/TMEM64 family protein [Chlamydiota bacterium]
MNKTLFLRLLPIIIITLLMTTAYFLEFEQYITFEQLKLHRQTLLEMVATYSVLAPVTFVFIYIITTALSIPAGAILSIAAGFLFPQPLSTIYVVIGATIGATCIFLAAKSALGDLLKKKAGPLLHKMHDGFHENAASYLLFLRLVPAAPFWLVNLAPAFFGVSLITFMWTTFVGIIPGTFVFTQAGAGLSSIFEGDNDLSIQSIFTTDIKIALIALAIFALLPVLIKGFKRRQKK